MTHKRVFNNLYTASVLKTELTKALDELDQILIEHCGPFASNCVIGSKWRQVNDIDEFTKDGIKIARHLIVSEDPAARFAARMARFVGIAVDKRCHDGTTTSMLTFCRLAKVAISQMDAETNSPNRYWWTKLLTTALNDCLSLIDRLKITEQDLFNLCSLYDIDTTIEEVRGALAYHMAMISSKGDDDLSTKVSEIIRSTPKKIFGMFRNVPLAVETQEPYVLKKQAYDISVNANPNSLHDFNHKNNTQYLTENAVLFVTGNEILKGSMESLFLNAFISTKPQFRQSLANFGTTKGWEDYHEDKMCLIILTPIVQDPELTANINIFNANNPACRIVCFNTQMHGRMRSSFNYTLHYMAGVPVFEDVMTQDATQSLIGLNTPAIKAHLIGHVLALSNFYEKDGEVYHPLYRNPSLFEPYTRFCKDTEELIEFAQSNISNPTLDEDELSYLVMLYRALTCQDIYDIEIGGSSHDQYANRTVYEDSIGAALSAINDGVVLGGYAHLSQHIRERLSDNDPNTTAEGLERSLYHGLLECFTSVVTDSMRVPFEDDRIYDRITKNGYSKWDYVVADTKQFVPGVEGYHYVKRQTLESRDDLLNFLAKDSSSTILFQAYTGYQEQFRRFIAMLPRIASTSTLADMRIRDEDAENVR